MTTFNPPRLRRGAIILRAAFGVIFLGCLLASNSLHDSSEITYWQNFSFLWMFLFVMSQLLPMIDEKFSKGTTEK